MRLGMEYTITAIKADVGSIAGHTRPSIGMLSGIEEKLRPAKYKDIIDYRIMHTGDDICLLMTHNHGKDAKTVHDLAMECFIAASEIARDTGCYAAGQDIKVDAPTGNVKGAGPGVAELTVKQTKDRPSEQLLIFAADKTSPGAYNLPVFKIFDPIYNDAALLSKLSGGALLEVMDMEFKDEDKFTTKSGIFRMPEDLYKVAVLLKNPNRYAISSIKLVSDAECGNEFLSASTDRLHNITGKYEGKDDPVMIVRAQKQFPAVEEIIQQFTAAHFVPGGARGSHVGPLMPVKMNYFTGYEVVQNPSMEPFCCPIVSCVGYSIVDGRIISSPVDMFDSNIFDDVRRKAARKFEMIRENGFVEPGMLPDGEVEYVDGYNENLKKAQASFTTSKKQ